MKPPRSDRRRESTLPNGVVAMLVLVTVIVLSCLNAGCGSALETTTNALGAYRVVHNGVVESIEIVVRDGAVQVGRECVESGRPPEECTGVVAAHVRQWRVVEAATNALAEVGDTVTLVVYRWSLAVDDGEGDKDEIPPSVRAELEIFCPKVLGWAALLTERGVPIPTMATDGLGAVCND